MSPDDAGQDAKATATPLVLYLEIDEEVASIIDRVRQLAAKQVALVIPAGSALLASAVNLKLLARQLTKLGKELTIVTKDKKGKRLAVALGIPVLTEIKKGESKKARAPKSARKKEPEKFGDLGIAEVVKKQRLKDKMRGIDSGKEPSPEDLEVIRKEAFPHLPQNRKLLFIFVLVTLMLVGTVFALVVPNTTIILEPKADTMEYLTNVTLADAKLNY